MLHVEWDEAASCKVSLLTPVEANAELRPDEDCEHSVLLLGGYGGGALAVEGTPEQLKVFARRILAVVDNPEV